MISSKPILYAEGALILKGDFVNHQGYDLNPLLKFEEVTFLDK